MNFCEIDQRLTHRVSRNYYNIARKFLEFSGAQVNEQAVRGYLAQYLSNPASTYNNQLDGIRALVARYLDRPEVTARFKKAPVPLNREIELPTKEQLRKGFEAQDCDRDRAIYLFAATTGLRHGEIWHAKIEEVDFATRAVKPQHWTRTKRAGVTFYNEECERYLKTYLATRHDERKKLFVLAWRAYLRIWKKASAAAGFRIRPQVMRYWFSTEMGELLVPDRFVDVFQGRAPQSVLAKFYTGKGLERLKRIYDGAGLRLLT